MTINVTLNFDGTQCLSLLKKELDDQSKNKKFKYTISGELQITGFDEMKFEEGISEQILLNETSDTEVAKLMNPVVWKKIKEEICEEYDLTHVAYKEWVEPLVITKISETTATIAVPELCGVEYVKLKYGSILQKKMEEWIGKKLQLEFTVINDF